MSIKLNVTDEQKKQLANLDIEARVLNSLLNERKSIISEIVKGILEVNSLSSKLYVMKFNSHKDLWEAELIPGVISLPGKVGVNPKGNGG